MKNVNKILVGACIVLSIVSVGAFSSMAKYKKDNVVLKQKELYYQEIIKNDELIQEKLQQLANAMEEYGRLSAIEGAKIAEIDGNIVVIDFNGEFHSYEYIGGNPTE